MKFLKRSISLSITLFIFISTLLSQNVGINTDTPEAVLDINGDVIFRPGEILLADSVEQVLDVNSTLYAIYRISGPTADFEISGISPGLDGRILTLFNRSGFNMIMHALDTDIDTTERILTSNGTDLVVADKNMVSLFYDGVEARWIVKSTSKDAGGGWDISGNNVFYSDSVGIGTSQPVSPLTIQTDVNETGFTQMGGVDSITLSSRINTGSASIGTTSNHVFSLTSGGIDQMHLWPDGRVVIGEDVDPNAFAGPTHSRDNPTIAKLTLETPINSTGWMHVGGADSIIVTETIGGISAAMGTATNHAFRLNAGSLGRIQIYPDGNVVLGTSSEGSFSKFTVHTPNNSYGISHVSDGGVILRTLIGGVSGGIGTFSNHTMRLFANAEAALNIEPSGNVILGTTSDLAFSKLTVHTPNNSYGLSHVSDGGVVIKTLIGGISGGIGTFSNHMMRIFANSEAAINIESTGNVGIGTTNFSGYKLAVNGNIRAKEIVVETGWADYVFDPGYKLNSLKNVEIFIQQNHHLPNIPTSVEIENGGLNVGEVQKKMMEKIEELTLYIIALEKRIDELEKTSAQ